MLFPNTVQHICVLHWCINFQKPNYTVHTLDPGALHFALNSFTTLQFFYSLQSVLQHSSCFENLLVPHLPYLHMMALNSSFSMSSLNPLVPPCFVIDIISSS